MFNTVTESPNRKLRREMGWTTVSRGRLRVSDNLPFNCGDRVHRVEDPRHVGRVESGTNNVYVNVLWDGTPKLLERGINYKELERSKP